MVKNRLRILGRNKMTLGLSVKIITSQDEKRASFPLFERCYEFEREGTPEEQRNDASSYNDRTLMEMMRLGACDGNPRGLYPVEVVASIWDEVTRTARERQKFVVDSREYERDLEEIRRRIERFGPSEITHLYLDGSKKFRYGGVFLLDPDRGAGYEFEGYGVHEASVKDLVTILLINRKGDRINGPSELIRGQSRLIRGQYFIKPDLSTFTQGVSTRVIFLEEFTRRNSLEKILQCMERDPFCYGGFVYTLRFEIYNAEGVPKQDKRRIDCYDWSDRGVHREDLCDSQIEVADELARRIREGCIQSLQRVNRISKLQRAMGLIFLDQHGELVDE